MNMQDLIEILFFASCFYYLARWLSQDKEKKLLLSFYGYCALLLVSHIAQLTTINAVLFLFSPAILIGFMLMHQTLLQRNMVSLKNITAAQKAAPADWLSPVIRLAITMLHRHKTITILIEHTDALAMLVKAEYSIDAPINNDILFMIATQPQSSNMLWIRTDGTIRGVNTQWKESDGSDWAADALLYTSANDSMVLVIDGLQENCMLAHNGTIEQGLSIDQADQTIRKKINYHLSNNNKGYMYEIPHQKTAVNERNS